MNAISCPFSSRRCKTSASSLKQPSAFNPSGTSFSTSLQCVSATRTTHFVYATCYLCLGHVCYLCLGLGPVLRPTGSGAAGCLATIIHSLSDANFSATLNACAAMVTAGLQAADEGKNELSTT